MMGIFEKICNSMPASFVEVSIFIRWTSDIPASSTGRNDGIDRVRRKG
jgi:hypothetical protein